MPGRRLLLENWFHRRRRSIAKGWANEAIWPFFAADQSFLDNALNPQGPHADFYLTFREGVFEALSTFAQLPGDLQGPLFQLALGSAKGDRVGAQRVLDQLRGKEARIIDALSSAKAENRTAAAQWIARLKIAEATPALEAALKKEKNDGAAGALMSALEILGVPVERFLDRKQLAKDAVKGLAKGVPGDLEWMPFTSLPRVTWADTGEVIPAEVVQWLIVQSFKLKAPEPGGVLRQYCRHMRVADRESLASALLTAWLVEDVRSIPYKEADERARQEAPGLHQSMQNHPDFYDTSPFKGLSEQQLHERLLQGHLKTPVGSAISSKGILAVVAACGGSDIAPMAHRYLKEWYGTRAAQGKVLIQMLAWVEHPTATQLVLSIGSRFRTKGFQEEATRQAQLLAERRGWTLDELSDRTIPLAGFDESGLQAIEYPQRKFNARLTAELEIELSTEEGRTITSLPDARKDEDESVVKEAKKQLATARKEIKGVLQLQKERLYEALCTQRSWRFDDWDLYLNRHPIVRYYCQQLVWRGEWPGKVATFRPLEDGSLAGVDGDAITLDSQARVSIAHDTNVTPEVVRAWVPHFKDFKVTPLFQQFGKAMYSLPADRRESLELNDFQGHLVEAFLLRGRANKLGYVRGSAEDAGWFFCYERRFPTLGIEASVRFSGNSLPEEKRTVALLALAFQRKTGQGGDQSIEQVPLGEIPSVLLSECWNDLSVMAADGSGFDPEWEKKVYG